MSECVNPEQCGVYPVYSALSGSGLLLRAKLVSMRSAAWPGLPSGLRFVRNFFCVMLLPIPLFTFLPILLEVCLWHALACFWERFSFF